ncbi:uncharacterized protein LOC133626017 [Colius striatus]|uniref:uncharacterized protein LOC133626017 n=1 Tax=Colius striatus TaxID=57412 RepID=UPI002B1D5667|nr:uncharacterized protein LOC133626017 [Colius striatus]
MKNAVSTGASPLRVTNSHYLPLARAPVVSPKLTAVLAACSDSQAAGWLHSLPGAPSFHSGATPPKKEGNPPPAPPTGGPGRRHSFLQEAASGDVALPPARAGPGPSPRYLHRAAQGRRAALPDLRRAAPLKGRRDSSKWRPGSREGWVRAARADRGSSCTSAAGSVLRQRRRHRPGFPTFGRGGSAACMDHHALLPVPRALTEGDRSGSPSMLVSAEVRLLLWEFFC